MSLATAILKIPVIAVVMVHGDSRYTCCVIHCFSFLPFHFNVTNTNALSPVSVEAIAHAQRVVLAVSLIGETILTRVVSCSTLLRLAFVPCIPCFCAFFIYTEFSHKRDPSLKRVTCTFNFSNAQFLIFPFINTLSHIIQNDPKCNKWK
jgi:hypothetical protein